jgi:lysophospholipid acyltransferase (LPLAT)-like uncharacterized protein
LSFLQFLGSRFGHLAVRLIGWTWRVTTIGEEKLEAARKSGVPLLLIVWHGRMLVPVWQQSYRHIVAMISQHSDGEMVARLVQRLGYETVRGSSTRGGGEAALEMLRRIKGGQTAAMICDGPRGPFQKMKPGTPFLSIQSGAVVIPTSFAAKRCWTFHSWDKFTLPKPFARVCLIWGDPIPAQSSDTDVDAFGLQLENVLNELTERAEAMARKV